MSRIFPIRCKCTYRSLVAVAAVTLASAAGQALAESAGAIALPDPQSASRGDPASLDKVTEALKAGDSARAAHMLLPMAEIGYSTAQLLLGQLYLEGNGVPQDRVRGLAWLRIAQERAQAGTTSGDQWVARQALSKRLSIQAGMDTPELIAVDQLAMTIESDLAAKRTTRFRELVRLYTDLLGTAGTDRGGAVASDAAVLLLPDADNDTPLIRRGCALARTLQCPDLPAAKSRPPCTGIVELGDVDPTIASSRARLEMPHFHGRAGVTSLLIHVNRDGAVCSILLEESSGEPLVDRAAADAAKQWSLDPARKGGSPVESLTLVRIAVGQYR